MDRRTFLAGAAAGAAAWSYGARASDAIPSGGVALVDSHVHFWDPARLRYPWIAPHEVLNRPYLPADYFAAAAPHRVERLVFVEAACLPGQALGEVAWVEELAAADPRIAAIVATAPLELGEGVAPTLAWLAERPLVRGVRRLLQTEPGADYGLRPGYVAGARLLGAHDLICELGVRRDQLAAAKALAEQCPETRFILNHIGGPDLRGGELDPWRADLAALAGAPNVWCKLSGVATAAHHDAWTVDDIRPAVDHALACFGAERMLFGSDWPVMRLATEFPRWVDAVLALTARLDEAARAAILRGNTAALYRI